MGFKDKLRNNQNAEHATVEDYRRSIQEKYLANRGKPPATIEVPAPAVVEPIQRPIKVPQFEEVPAFIKSRVFEPVESEQEQEEETVKEPEEETVEEPAEEEVFVSEPPVSIKSVIKPTVKPTVKPVTKKTKSKKKDPASP